jgi:hypothetical protein
VVALLHLVDVGLMAARTGSQRVASRTC